MEWKSYVRSGFAGADAPDEDVIEELAQHAEALFEQAIAAGESERQARRRVDDLLRAWQRDSQALRRHQPPSAPPAGSRTVRVRLLLMSGQIAVASLLLVGAALLGRSFVGMLHADRGFDPGGVLTARLPLPEGLYTPERRHLVLEKLLERLARTPGIE